MSHHDQPTLDEIELPELKGRQVDFWNGSDRHIIYADQDYAWVLNSPGGRNGFHRSIEFSRHDEGFRLTGRDVSKAVVADWRDLIRHELRR